MEHTSPNQADQHDPRRVLEGGHPEHERATTRRTIGAMSVDAAMLSPSSIDGLDSRPVDALGSHARQGERLRKPMPIMLATSGKGADAERVAAMLDEQGIAYSTVFVETYDRPRLQVGAAELVGESEIAAHLAEIRELSLA